MSINRGRRSSACENCNQTGLMTQAKDLRLLLTAFSIILFFFSLSTSTLFAQFGQNKVQYKVFDWFYIESKHFDIYFNKGGEYIAQYTAVKAEETLARFEDNIKYKIRNRIPIIVFNSHNEFQQNNIIEEYLPEGVGGVTELFKNRIVIPFEGDYSNFRHVIAHELLHAYMNDMYYGGSLQNIISQNIRLQFPLWFSEGMAEYQSLDGMDKPNDMFMRDAVVYDYMPPVERLSGYLAYRGGQSFFAWLADEYGKDKIGDLMTQIKVEGDVDDGFFDVYKADVEELSEKWQKSLKQTYWPDFSSRQELSDFSKRLTNHKHGDGFYNTAPAISPNGKFIAYISNRDDYFDVFIAEAETGETVKKLIAGNTTTNYEELHLLTPGLSWSPDNRKIAISVKSGSKDAIRIINVNSETEKELPIKFDGIFSVDWSPKGDKLTFVGNNSRQSDIWIYNLKTKELEAATSDIFSDSDPKWSRDGKKIYFTSDRGDYTDPKTIPPEFKMSNYDHSEKDLYVYDTERKTLRRFSGDRNANESNVVSSADGKKVLFISDKNGINNIWLKDVETGEEKPLTNSLDPITMMSISEDGKKLVFSALNEGGYNLFHIDDPFSLNLDMATLPKTAFQKELAGGEVKTGVKDSLLVSRQDSVLKSEDLDTTRAKDLGQQDTDLHPQARDLGLQTADSTAGKDTVKLYGEDIRLNLNTRDTTQPTAKLKEPAKFKLKDNVAEDGSLRVNRYKIKFSPDIIYSNVSYSSFYGVQGIAQMAFSDMLGNHRIYIATSLVLDLKNSDYAFAYYYLPKRIDYGFEGYHSARFLLIDVAPDSSQVLNLYRYRTYGATLNASYPINKFNRIDGGLTFNTLSKENLDDPNEPPQRLNYLVPIVSFVHDNTLFGYTAPIRGKRFNLTALGTPKIGADGVSFLSLVGDYRTYVNIVEDYTFAWRLTGGASLGPNPQRFYVGGTPNWINYELTNQRFPIESIQDFAFSTPVMPLRGFNYNARSGSKFFLMNAELRFPLLKYLVLGPLPLGFQNIQGVLFTDIASAWYNTRKLQLFSSRNGEVVTKDLLFGLGIGARIFLLYFPLKFDIAWSYDLDKFSRPKYYISLGADF
jgi:Tol biopolymer transport system component